MRTKISSPYTQPSLPPLPPREILILGAGHFGSLAAHRLKKRYPKAVYLVVDQDQAKLATIAQELKFPVRDTDAIRFLTNTLLTPELWLVPAVPVHVAFLWLLDKFGKTASIQTLPVPPEVDPQVPNPFRTQQGTVYSSYATFKCPDNCSEPSEICTYTRQPRLGNLFEDLARISVTGYRVHVLRSWQLAPGVGGYTGKQLRELYDEVARTAGRHLIATSCRCHSVLDALLWI